MRCSCNVSRVENETDISKLENQKTEYAYYYLINKIKKRNRKRGVQTILLLSPFVFLCFICIKFAMHISSLDIKIMGITIISIIFFCIFLAGGISFSSIGCKEGREIFEQISFNIQERKKYKKRVNKLKNIDLENELFLIDNILSDKIILDEFEKLGK